MTTEHCHAHPTAPARTVCRTCLRPLCSVCTVLDDRMRPQCVECIQRRSRRNTRVAVALLVLGALGVTAYLVRAHRGGPAAMGAAEDAGPPEQPYDYGASADKVHRLEGQLGKEPCDRRKIVELCDEMLRAGDSRGTIRRAEAFFQACGDHPRLRWLTYGAHKQLSEWDQASAEATKLIESNPYDADFRAWRGIVYEQKGDLEHAVEDYRQAMVLRPRLSDVAMSLANLYERQHKPCDGHSRQGPRER